MPRTKAAKVNFPFTIEYFLPGGAFFRRAWFMAEVRAASPMRTPAGVVGHVPNMDDVVAKVRGWRDCAGTASLPGLTTRDGWDGPIIIRHSHPEAVPRLILPPDLEKK